MLCGWGERTDGLTDTGAIVCCYYTDGTFDYTSVHADVNTGFKIFYSNTAKTVQRFSITYVHGGTSKLKLMLFKGSQIPTSFTPAPEDILLNSIRTTQNCSVAVVDDKLKITSLTPDTKTGYVDATISYGEGFLVKKRFTWSKVVDTKEALDNLAIGTRNLIQKSADYWFADTDGVNTSIRSKGMFRITSNDYANCHRPWIPLTKIVEPGKTYTLSIDVNVQGDYFGNLTFWFNARGFNPYQMYSSDEKTVNYIARWTRISATITIPTSANFQDMHLLCGFSATGANGLIVLYKDISLTESSNIADYSEAPEDVQARIDAEKQRINEIFSDDIADPSEKQQLLLRWNEIVTEHSKITTQASKYMVGVSILNQYYDTLANSLAPILSSLTTSTNLGDGGGAVIRTNFTNYYNTRAIVKNNIEDKIDALAKGYVEAIEIGGKNYIRNGNFLAGTNEWNANYGSGHTPPVLTALNAGTHVPDGAMGCLKVETSNTINGIWQNFTDEDKKLELNKPYTLSFLLKKEMAGTLNFNFGYEGQSTLTRAIAVNGWQRHQLTFTPTQHKNIIFYAQNAGTFYITNVALHPGTQRQPFRNGYLDEALGVDGEQRGGLSLNSVIAARNAQKVVRSYMSGVDSNPTAFAAGVQNFGQFNETRMIEINHDGSGHLAGKRIKWNESGKLNVGALEVDEQGNLRIYEDISETTQLERLLFSKLNLPSAAELLGTDTGSGSQSFTLFSNSAGTTISTQFLDVTKPGSTLSVNLPVDIQLQRSASNSDAVLDVSIKLIKDGLEYTEIDYRRVRVSPPANVGNLSFVINKNYTVPHGQYKLAISLALSNVSFANVTIDSGIMSWLFKRDVRQFVFGLDGFMSWYTNNKMHFTESKGLLLRGETDMPGVLLAGDGYSGGNGVIRFGAKKHATIVVEKLSGNGYYRVWHSIGHNNYTVQLTLKTAGLTAIWENNQSSYFDVKLYNGAVLANGNFSFVVYGSN